MKKALLFAVALLMVTACENPATNTTNSWTKSIEGFMVTQNTTSGESYQDNAIVTLEMTDITKPFFNLTIEGIKFVPMMPDVNFLISDVPFKIYPSEDKNDPLYGSWIFNEASVVPSVGGISREEYTMYNFKGSISDYGYVLDFDVNFGGTLYHASFGKNEAIQSYEATFAAIATVVLNPGDNSTVFEEEFTISFEQANLSKQVIDVTLSDIRFVGQMPEITMVFKDVPFIMSEDGSRIFNVATIVPKVNNVDFPDYTITNLTGTVSKSTILLDCDIAAMNTHVSISGTSKK